MRESNELSMTVNFATATTASEVYNIKHINNIGVHYFTSGAVTAAGKIEVLASVDGENFFVHDTANISASSATVNAGIKVVDCAFPFLKLLYTKTSGTGSMKVYISFKGI